MKTRRDPEAAGRESWSARARLPLRTALGGLAAFFGCLLAVASVSGLALAHGVSGAAALLAAGAVGLLPIPGLAAFFGGGRGAWVGAALAWPLCLLLALPHYFPGERAEALAGGLRWLAAPLGERTADSIAMRAGKTIDSLAQDRAPLPRLAPADAGEPILREPGDGSAGTELAMKTDVGEAGIRLAYEGDGHSVRIPVRIDGPDFGARFAMLFDTGASYTTLGRSAFEQLGLRIDEDAPRVTMHTANGEIEAPLLLVDAVWLGDAAVEWVTVAVCDSCAGPESAGLLGLNVSSQFRIALDQTRHQIELRPLAQPADRTLDVGPWLDLRSEARRWWDGRVEVYLSAHNRSQQPIERAVVGLECSDAGFAVQIDAVPASGDASTQVSLPSGTDCSLQRLELRSARWRLDRF